MTHLEEELAALKKEVSSMFALVHSQLEKALKSLTQFDKDVAHEVVVTEDRVNGQELKIDRDCENLLALYAPVAVDLRYVLAVMKINTNLERTGDIAEGIARFLIDSDTPFEKKLLEQTQLLKGFEVALKMMEEIEDAFNSENTSVARAIFRQDVLLDHINGNIHKIASDYVRQHPESLEHAMHILSMIRKLERVGDHAKNMAEELIFYIEAKVLKHTDKKRKQ